MWRARAAGTPSSQQHCLDSHCWSSQSPWLAPTVALGACRRRSAPKGRHNRQAPFATARKQNMTDHGSQIRVLIVDDHPLLRDGIAAVVGGQPDMAVVGEAANGAEAVERYRAVRPDVTLMDLQMPAMGGTNAIRKIRTE